MYCLNTGIIAILSIPLLLMWPSFFEDTTLIRELFLGIVPITRGCVRHTGVITNVFTNLKKLVSEQQIH